MEITDIFTLTLTAEDGSTTETVSFTATAATVANVSAGLVAAVNALAGSTSKPMFAAVSATDITTALTITSRSPGIPFYLTSSTTDGGGANTQTLVTAATTPNSGPFDWNTALNWSTKAVPQTGDDVVISGRAANGIMFGLNQASVTLTRLSIDMAMTYDVGTILYALKIGATVCDLGGVAGDGSSAGGSALININFGSVQNTTIMRNSRNGGTKGRPPVQLVGTHASNRLTLSGGTLGFGTATSGQSGALLNVTALRGSLLIGSAVTLTAANSEIVNAGATVYVNSACLKIKASSGYTHVNGTGLLTTLDLRGSTTVYLNNRPSGVVAITNLLMNSGQATLDVRGDPRVLTITATTINAGQIARVLSNYASQITFTDGAVVSQDAADGASNMTGPTS